MIEVLDVFYQGVQVALLLGIHYYLCQINKRGEKEYKKKYGEKV